MPLAHQSTSHGSVAFGFFQIESHMLLLERLFFFADDFCEAVDQLAAQMASDSQAVAQLEGWRIIRPTDVGNLHGAIAGQDLSGFIGATYERYPFPARQEDFKQNPEGHRTRDWIRSQIERFAKPDREDLLWDTATDLISLAEYSFTREQFGLLLAYVDRGGHPRWKDERQPDYVQRLETKLAAYGSAWSTAE